MWNRGSLGRIGMSRGRTVDWSTYWTPQKEPSNLIVTAMADTTIDFSWTAAAEVEDGYKLKISTDGITYTDKATVDNATTTAQATGLTAGVLYYFKVVAYTGTHDSVGTDVYDTRFKITVDTSKAGSANDTFILPTAGAGSYDYYVDWGDGGAEEHVTANTSQTHDYNATGTYQIKIRGTFPQIYFNNGGDKAKLMTIDNWGNIKWSSMGNAFRGCAVMQGNYYDVPNLTTASFNISGMFMSCSVFNYPVPFDTSAVTNMSSMFYWALAFNQPVLFNTGNVTNISAMFDYAIAFNQDISSWNIENVTSASNFMRNVNLWSLPYYDALLVSWGAQDVNNTITIDFGDCCYSPSSDAATARAHLVLATGSGGHGWTITDGGVSFDKGKLVFAWDDATATSKAGIDEQIAKSVGATIFVVGDLVGDAAYMTWAELQAYNAAGVDIQCHGYTHTNFTTLTEEQVLQQLTDNNNIFTTNSLPSPVHLAYPYGGNNASVRGWVATLRSSARGATYSGVHIKPASGKYTLIGLTTGTRTIAYLMGVVDLLKTNKEAVIMYAHGINSSEITLDDLNTLIDYCQAQDVDMITISELIALMP